MELTAPDGTNLRYDDTGSGEPPIVFVHGWCCNRTNWRGQVPHYMKDHRIIALDQRGHGESDKPDQDYTIAGFVDDLTHVIQSLDIDRPIIIGHSMGGVIAMNFARKHPDAARAIVMIDSPALPLPEALQPVLESSVVALQSDNYVEVVKGFASVQFFNADSPPDLVDEIIAGVAEAPQRLMHTAIADIFQPHNQEPGPIPVPTLFIRAATNYAPQGAQEERFPGIECDEVNAAHFLQIERPDETNAMIDRFLARVTEGARA
jgi:pimeloyl-ACP methyl ester carboxylesterase